MGRTTIGMAVLALVLIAAQPARADYETGQRAWDAGSVDEALAQWRAAAEGGDRRAMLALGRLYVQGLGVLQDYVEAHKWLNLAASRGEAVALKERDALSERMTPEERAEAQKLARRWRPGASQDDGAPDAPVTQAAAPAQTPASAPTAAPTPEATPTPPRAIREAQALLDALGYRPGPADGIWGRRTGEAYRAFLRDAGLPGAETLTPEALHAMRAIAKRQGGGAKAGHDTTAVGTTPRAPSEASAPSPAPVRPEALHRAAQAGDVDGLKAAIAAGVDVDARDGRGWTALMHAVNKGYTLLVPPLVDAQANLNIRAPDGATALFMAAVQGHTEIIELLMKAGAEVSVKGPKGKTAADAARARYGDRQAAMKAGEPLSVIALLGGKTWEEVKNDEVAVFVYEATKAGNTHAIAKALITTIFEVDAKAVGALVDAGADVNARDEYGTPLLHAVSLLSDDRQEPDEVIVEIMKILIKGGADVNARDEYGNTPLHGFVTRRLPEAVRVLIEAGADVNARTENGHTPLHASHNSYAPNRAEIIRILIKGGADVNARDESGETPLHSFALVGPPEAVEALIDAGADLTVIDAYDNSPLFSAMCCSFDEERAAIIRILVDAGADINEMVYNSSILFYVEEGGTTFHGTEGERRAFIKFLRSLGARVIRR